MTPFLQLRPLDSLAITLRYTFTAVDTHHIPSPGGFGIRVPQNTYYRGCHTHNRIRLQL